MSKRLAIFNAVVDICKKTTGIEVYTMRAIPLPKEIKNAVNVSLIQDKFIEKSNIKTRNNLSINISIISRGTNKLEFIEKQNEKINKELAKDLSLNKLALNSYLESTTWHPIDADAGILASTSNYIIFYENN